MKENASLQCVTVDVSGLQSGGLRLSTKQSDLQHFPFQYFYAGTSESPTVRSIPLSGSKLPFAL